MYSFRRYKSLPPEIQINELSVHGISLDLAYCTKEAEAVLFAYNDFYVELVVKKYTDDIISITSFRNTTKLEPYLGQVDITAVNLILAFWNN